MTPAERGFGLVETLIATAIIAVMASLTFKAIASNAQAARTMADRRLAVMVGQSALDFVNGTAADAAAPRRGLASGLAWSATIEPYTVGSARTDGRPLQLITVAVARPGASSPLLRLRTLAIGR